jgi:hypothetical protein
LSDHSELPTPERRENVVGAVHGDAFFFIAGPPPPPLCKKPAVPDGQARLCPQCAAAAWRRTRHCWRCGFDFDRRRTVRRYCLWAAAIGINCAVLLIALATQVQGIFSRA